MMFRADNAAPGSRSFSLQPADMNGDDIYVGLHAHDFGRDAVNMARATITYDPGVVSLVSFSSADSWMSAFGYQPTFSVGKSGTNQIRVRVDIPSSSAGASGSGRILRLRFRKVSAGTSRLELIEGRAYDAGYNNTLQAAYGGTIEVK
jgi:hypothetical protein